MFRMLGLRSENDQILRGVVSFVAITVVNCLVFPQRATQYLFCNDPVLMNPEYLRVCLALTSVQAGLSDLFSGFRGHSRGVQSPVHFRKPLTISRIVTIFLITLWVCTLAAERVPARSAAELMLLFRVGGVTHDRFSAPITIHPKAHPAHLQSDRDDR